MLSIVTMRFVILLINEHDDDDDDDDDDGDDCKSAEFVGMNHLPSHIRRSVYSH